MGSTVPWTVPPFQSRGQVQCDADSNLYFNVWSGEPPSAVLKVARDSSRYELYTLPSKTDEGQTAFIGFNVTPSGTLRILGYTFFAEKGSPPRAGSPYSFV